jgi:hypothetical protein
MTNPFVYGSIVEGEDFADRTAELEELEKSLSKSENVLLCSPPKYGKKSLMINTLNKMRKEGALCIFLNLNKVTSLHRLLGLYIKAVAIETERDRGKALNFCKSVIPNGHADVNIDLDNLIDPGMKTIQGNMIERAAGDVFSLPQKIALKKEKKFVVAINEFQDIEGLDGKNTLESLKRCVQKDDHVSYFFSCKNLNNRSDLKKLYQDHKINKVLELEKISRINFIKFLESKFEKTGYDLEPGVVNEILERTNDYAYNAQFLCHDLWNIKRDEKKIKKKDISTALLLILTKQFPFYASLWSSLTLHQRNVLRAVAKLGGEQVFSRRFADQGGVGSLTSLQTSILLLQKKGILIKIEKRYEFADVFFREWICTEIT